MNGIWNCFLAYAEMSTPDIAWTLVFAIVFYFAFWFITKKECNSFFRLMLSFSCSLIVIMTLFGRAQGEYESPHFFFESYRNALALGTPEQVLQLVMNVVLYIPLGLFLPCCFRLFEKVRYAVLTAFLCSVCIETIQGVFGIGCYEVDDILNNTLGALIGVLLYQLIVRVKERWQRRCRGSEERMGGC